MQIRGHLTLAFDEAVQTLHLLLIHADGGREAGGRYAVATHKGPYSELSKTYRSLYGGWLPQSGHRLRDVPAFEQYLNSPQNTRPEDLLTLIHVPLE